MPLAHPFPITFMNQYSSLFFFADPDRIIDSDTGYQIRRSHYYVFSEFTRIICDLSQLGRIELSKLDVRFANEGEAASGTVLVLLRQAEGATIYGSNLHWQD